MSVSSQDLSTLERKIEALQALSDRQARLEDEMVRYRGFWGEAWPEGLRRLDNVVWTVGIMGGVLFVGLGIFGGCALWQMKRQTDRTRQNSDVQLINDIAKEYASEPMWQALNAIHATRDKPPVRIEGTDLDGYRRMVAHFWIRLAVLASEGVRDDLLQKYFVEKVDDWPQLARLERMKLIEMYTRQDLTPDAVQEKVSSDMTAHPIQKLYDRWHI
jgi:hypothetical protein